jgi:hypothetical protein
MAASAKTIIYAQQSDWDAWKNQFLRRAKDLRLWGYIDPINKTEWPVEPAEPALADYPLRAPPQSQGTVAANTPTSSQEDRIPTSTLDLTEAGRNAYNDAISLYKERKADYRRFESNREKLTAWVYDTVTPEVQEQYCNHEDTLREWYKNLMQANMPYEINRKTTLMEEYYNHLSNIKKSARTLPMWIQGWKTHMARGIRHGVSACTDVNVWCNDLIKATQSLAVTAPWGQNVALNKRQDILTGKISYLEIIADLEAFVSSQASVPDRHIKRGAFPAFHGEDHDKPEDRAPTQTEDDPHHRGGRRGRGYRGGNKFARTEGGSRARCKACLQGHKLEDCFYVFPEMAYSKWTPVEGITKMVQDNLKEEPLRTEVNALIRKKKKPTDS